MTSANTPELIYSALKAAGISALMVKPAQNQRSDVYTLNVLQQLAHLKEKSQSDTFNKVCL